MNSVASFWYIFWVITLDDRRRNCLSDVQMRAELCWFSIFLQVLGKSKMKLGIIQRFNYNIKADISYWTLPKMYPLMICFCMLPRGHPLPGSSSSQLTCWGSTCRHCEQLPLCLWRALSILVIVVVHVSLKIKATCVSRKWIEVPFGYFMSCYFVGIKNLFKSDS